MLPEGRTALLTSGARAPLAVVLFHGFTNHPGQYAQFAPLLAERGVNVFAPRMWGHGYRDRMSRDLERFDMGKGLAGAYEALKAVKRGPKPAAVFLPSADEHARLRRENASLTLRLQRAEAIIEIQKKVALLLGLSMPSDEAS